MITTKVVGLEKARVKIRAVGTTLRGPLQDLLRREARLTAISLAKSSQPYGTGVRAQSLGVNAVARDINRIYATPAKAFRDIRDPHFAKAFWLLLEQGHTDRAIKILRDYGRTLGNVPWIRFDGGYLHLSHRDAKTGRVGKLRVPLAIVRNPKQLETYIGRKQKLVGFGKSGWADVARLLGGIRGLRAEDDITANWITRNGGQGNVLIYRSGEDTVIRLTNRVRYAERILSPRDRAVAVMIARERLLESIRIAKQYELQHLRAAA